MIKFFIPVFIVFLLLPFSVSATTYYVSRVDGSDSYNGLYPSYQGGSNGPWLTLAKSVSSISSGDTVYLRGGTWQDEQLDIEYKNYNSTTTFKAYPGETPVIDMRNSGTENSAKGIFLKRTDYLYIDGITVRNSGNHAINAEYCDHLTVVNCTTEHSRWSGIYIAASDNIEIAYNTVKWTHCRAEDHDHDTWTETYNGECLSIAEGCNNGNIHHNTISHGTTIQGGAGGEGLNIKAGCSYIYVHHNEVDQARDDGVESTRYAMGVDAWNTETHHIYFYKNIIKNGSWGIIFDSEDGGYGHHIYAWNNIIIHCGHSTDVPGGGIGWPQWGVEGLMQYCYFWNNIIYDSRYGLYIRHTVTAAPLVAQNNIFYNCSSDAIKWGSGTNQEHFTLNHNLVGTDPKFVNASAGDFHLMPDSPAIDAGITIPNVTDDFDGITRPQGAGYDIGAYEYVSVSGPKTYYVDSDIGNDANNCSQARSPSTPKRTVNSIMSCNPGAGDIVKFRGTFIHQKGLSQRIVPKQSGKVLYPFQAIQSVSGSTVTFNVPLSELNPATDYVTIYNSRKGNSGAFAVVSFSGNSATVNTSDLPLGSFISETAADPGDLHAAIVRPVHFTAWDKNNPPVWDMDLANPPDWPNTEAQTFYSFNQNVIMVSYLKTITDWTIWKAFEIDGNYNTSDPEYHSDYHIFDHLEVTNGVGAIGIEYHDFHTSYNIIQHNNFHDIGYNASGPDEIIYYGNAVNPGYEDKYKLHHDYVQIMYNKIGPHRVYKDGERLDVCCDGIEIKPSAHYATVWGNEVTGIQCNGCSDAPIKTDGTNTVISNNYIHDIAPLEEYGLKSCGISVMDGGPDIPEYGASGSIISNNIIANVKGVGMLILDVKNVKVLNNVIYQIPKDPHESDLKRNAGILMHYYLAPNTENIEIKNNIIQLVDNYGISAKSYSGTSVSDYNLIFQTPNAFYNVDQGDHDRLIDPEFINPSNRDFHLQASSPAIDAGINTGLALDFDYNLRPQGAGYDIGPFEYVSGQPPQPIPGDLNNDSRVDIFDLNIVALHFGKTNAHPQWNVTADVVVSNEIDIFDIVFIASRFT